VYNLDSLKGEVLTQHCVSSVGKTPVLAVRSLN
jgi:hypothetical protein